jgi:hypothetical protein
MLISIDLAGPQRCFSYGGYTFCNWVRRNDKQALVKEDGGYLRFPSYRKKSKGEEKALIINQKEKAPVVEN